MRRFVSVAFMRRSLARKQRGQVFVLVSLALIAMLGMAALAIDVGNLWTTRRQMQSAADAAAIAGIDSIDTTGSYSYITTAAQLAASQNGFADGSTTTGSPYAVSVAVYNPPPSGPDAGASNAVQVVITQKQPTYFMRVLGQTTVDMSTVATGVSISSGSCIFALDPFNTAVTVGGGGVLTSQCGLFDNSSLSVSGNSVIAAPVVGVVDTATINGGGSTTPVTGIASFGDPLASVSEPTPANCTNYNTQIINGGTTTLNPGTFCGGIKITSTGTTVNFNPGTYIMDGGGLTIGAGSIVNGSNVTFYLTGANKSNGAASSYGGVTIDGAATVNLSAPCTSGTGGIQYMLFFQDRSETNGAASKINGGSGSSFSGVMYFPTTTLNYMGNSAQGGYTLIIADDLNITGTTSIGDSFCSGGNPVQHATLVQ